VKKRVAPSAALEAAIDELLSEGLGDAERLAAVGRLGARVVQQRALEEEVAEFPGPSPATSELRRPLGSRNGVRPGRMQTAEGELEVQMPQLRDTAEGFVSKVLPHLRTVIRAPPLEALIIGAYVRGLSDRDIESLIQERAWARSPRAPPAGSARSCLRATGPSGPGVWPRSTCW